MQDMEATIRNLIHVDSTRMNIHDIVSELNKNLGTTIVQSMAGVKDRTSPTKWAKPDGPEPRPEVETRLRLGYRVWKTLEHADGKKSCACLAHGSQPKTR